MNEEVQHCKEPGCKSTEDETPFWGEYCLFCALFHKTKKPNDSQACKNYMKAQEQRN